jgi:hypothetical protein
MAVANVALKRTDDKPEAAALPEVIKALGAHPAVAWCERMNSGAFKVGQRFVRFGRPGCSDILGQMRDDRLLAVECKSAKGRLRPEQAIFLERVRGAGGLGFLARIAWRGCASWDRSAITARQADRQSPAGG